MQKKIILDRKSLGKIALTARSKAETVKATLSEEKDKKVPISVETVGLTEAATDREIVKDKLLATNDSYNSIVKV